MDWLGWVGAIPIAMVGALAIGCSDDASRDADDTGGATMPSPATDNPADDDAAADAHDDATPTSTTGPTSGDDDDGPNPTSGPDDSTGEMPVMLCNGWSDDGPREPWLALFGPGHVPLQSGGEFSVTCGGQGEWMFPIYPEMGGWALDGTVVQFAIQIDVEGFAGPSGSFFSAPSYQYDVECFEGGDTFDGGFFHSCIAVLPPDEGVDPYPSALHGAPATIHFEMTVPGADPVVLDLVDLTLSADVNPDDCGFL